MLVGNKAKGEKNIIGTKVLSDLIFSFPLLLRFFFLPWKKEKKAMTPAQLYTHTHTHTLSLISAVPAFSCVLFTEHIGADKSITRWAHHIQREFLLLPASTSINGNLYTTARKTTVTFLNWLQWIALRLFLFNSGGEAKGCFAQLRHDHLKKHMRTHSRQTGTLFFSEEVSIQSKRCFFNRDPCHSSQCQDVRGRKKRKWNAQATMMENEWVRPTLDEMHSFPCF